MTNIRKKDITVRTAKAKGTIVLGDNAFETIKNSIGK